VGRGYLVRKLLHALATLFFVVAFNFVLFRVMPGDPIELLTRSEKLTPDDVAELQAEYGLDQPLHVQYTHWVKRLLTLDFGTSFVDGRPVTKKIAERIVVELKDKMGELVGGRLIGSAPGDGDVVEALRGLGYREREVVELLKELPKDLEGSEARVKEVLKRLGKRR